MPSPTLLKSCKICSVQNLFTHNFFSPDPSLLPVLDAFFILADLQSKTLDGNPSLPLPARLFSFSCRLRRNLDKYYVGVSSPLLQEILDPPLFYYYQNNEEKMDPSPFPFVMHPIIIDTVVNLNGHNKEHGLKSVNANHVRL